METEIKEGYFDGSISRAIASGKKPLLHRILLSEPTELVDLAKVAQFYAETIVFKGTSTKIQPRSRWSIEPRFSLGKSGFVHALTPLAKAKIQRYKIRQIVAPGSGGICAIAVFLNTGQRLNWASVRVDSPKKERMLTAFDGYLDPSIPTWITDDYLASGNGAIKTLRVLRAHGFKAAGFIPIIADLSGNTGARAFQTIGTTMRFTFDYIMGLQKRSDEKTAKLVPIDSTNKSIYD